MLLLSPNVGRKDTRISPSEVFLERTLQCLLSPLKGLGYEWFLTVTTAYQSVEAGRK